MQVRNNEAHGFYRVIQSDSIELNQQTEGNKVGKEVKISNDGSVEETVWVDNKEYDSLEEVPEKVLNQVAKEDQKFFEKEELDRDFESVS